jgi:phage-related protein (TIGR01555 family)
VANVASLVYESRVDVITIPGLADLLSEPETEELLLRRFALMARMKGNNGLVMLNGTTTPGDPSEEWQQKNATFTTLPDIITKAQEEVSAAARIPRAILFGTGAGGLGATGDLELSAYYDHVNSLQTNAIEPAISILDECLIRDALGNRPAEVWYKWASLWQMSDKELAELADKFAGAFEKIARSGILPAEVMTQSVVNRFTESGILPGLEGDYNEWVAAGGMEELGEEDDDEDNPDDDTPRPVADFKYERPKTVTELLRDYLAS